MMDRRSLLWIISLAAIALLGLLSIQVYWIRNGLNIREANFRLAVDHVVRQVIYQLELQDAGLILHQQDHLISTGDQILGEMDSLRYTLDNYLKGPSLRSSPYHETQKPNQGELSYPPLEITIVPETDHTTDGSTHKTSSSRAGMGLAEERAETDSQNKSKKKQLMVDKILDGMIQDGNMPDIEKRLTAKAIDTLLREAFEARGISLDYLFGVYSPSRNDFVIQNPGTDRDVLLRKGMVFPLFPSEHRSIPDYLLLWFPGEREALLRELWGMAGISVLLLLVIMLTLVYSISIVLKQRKFAEMKNDFINNMTHEFKTPVSTVALACEALTDIEISKSESLYEEYINIISEENKRLGVMAEKILQTAIMEKGQVRLKQERFDLHGIIEDVIRNIRIQVEIKDGTISTSFMAAHSILEADRVHISNVIYNLLDNANKYTPRKPDIKVSTENNPKGIIIKVSDNGIGISKAHQRKVFDKLYRVPMGDIHDFKGFGLGLSYVKTIVEQHGGSVGLESELNKGSEFRLFLPLQQ